MLFVEPGSKVTRKQVRATRKFLYAWQQELYARVGHYLFSDLRSFQAELPTEITYFKWAAIQEVFEAYKALHPECDDREIALTILAIAEKRRTWETPIERELWHMMSDVMSRHRADPHAVVRAVEKSVV